MNVEREQQKIYLTPDARKKLRDEAADRKCEMSDIVEHLLMHECLPPHTQKD